MNTLHEKSLYYKINKNKDNQIVLHYKINKKDKDNQFFLHYKINKKDIFTGQSKFTQCISENLVKCHTGVGEQEANVVSIFRFHDFVVEFIHYPFRKVQNGLSRIDGFG